MRISLDDAQIARNSMGKLADLAVILDEELQRVGFSERMRGKMILSWWTTLNNSALVLDLQELINMMTEEDED